MAEKKDFLKAIKEKAAQAAETLENVKLVDKDGNTIVDVAAVKEKAANAGEYIGDKAADIKSDTQRIVFGYPLMQ